MATAEELAKQYNPTYRPGAEGISAFMGYRGASDRWRNRRKSENIIDLRGKDTRDYNQSVFIKMWVNRKNSSITRDQFSDRFNGSNRLMQAIGTLQTIVGVK